ncbi:MAG: hypothetical protein PHD46_06035, partial [Eubacteriales bacterium]|nr:hypothetical protein [Eubacteriales bacterium]
MLIQLEQSQQLIRDLKKGIEELSQSIKLNDLISEVALLEEQVNAAGFWSEPEKAQSILRLLKSKKQTLENYF